MTFYAESHDESEQKVIIPCRQPRIFQCLQCQLASGAADDHGDRNIQDVCGVISIIQTCASSP